MSMRYAVYFSPAPHTRWWAFGCAWLGYDAEACRAVPQPAIPDLPGDVFAAVTGVPWRYGFHATLKAPMRLADGVEEADFLAAVARLAAGWKAFTLPPLRVERLGSFLACTTAARDPRVHALADECVRELDAFRAPADAEEIARREAAGLGDAQRALLARWGYPYVLDEYRFHMTLTGPLDRVLPQVEIAVTEAATEAVAALADEPLVCDALCVYTQVARGAPFRLRSRQAFGR
jgi:putative phosphonate metabolism protein